MREGHREHQVIFVRHGQSTWNKANRFIGWTDTALTEEGLEEAREAGRIMVQNKIGERMAHILVDAASGPLLKLPLRGVRGGGHGAWGHRSHGVVYARVALASVGRRGQGGTQDGWAAAPMAVWLV